MEGLFPVTSYLFSCNSKKMFGSIPSILQQASPLPWGCSWLGVIKIYEVFEPVEAHCNLYNFSQLSRVVLRCIYFHISSLSILCSLASIRTLALFQGFFVCSFGCITLFFSFDRCGSCSTSCTLSTPTSPPGRSHGAQPSTPLLSLLLCLVSFFSRVRVSAPTVPLSHRFAGKRHCKTSNPSLVQKSSLFSCLHSHKLVQIQKRLRVEWRCLLDQRPLQTLPCCLSRRSSRLSSQRLSIPSWAAPSSSPPTSDPSSSGKETTSRVKNRKFLVAQKSCWSCWFLVFFSLYFCGSAPRGWTTPTLDWLLS